MFAQLRAARSCFRPKGVEREIELNDRAPDRLQLRLLSVEQAVARPDQEPEHQRQQRCVESDDGGDHAFGRGDVRSRQQRLQAKPGQRAHEGRDRYNRRSSDENPRRNVLLAQSCAQIRGSRQGGAPPRWIGPAQRGGILVP